MSAAIKTNRTKKFSFSAPALWIILGLAASLFLVRYWQQVLQEHSLDAQIANQIKINQQMSDENQRLQATLQYDQSAKYVEQRAREALNLRRPDEEVLIPVGGTGTDTTSPGTTTGSGQQSTDPVTTTNTTQSDGEDNWERWFSLFGLFGNSSDSSP